MPRRTTWVGPGNMPDESPRVLFDFAVADGAAEWQAVNDSVMGGVSEGRFEITPRTTLPFTGTF